MKGPWLTKSHWWESVQCISLEKILWKWKRQCLLWYRWLNGCSRGFETSCWLLNLATNDKTTPCWNILLQQYLEINSFNRIVKTVCSTKEIPGSEFKIWITIRGLRRTFSSLLFATGRLDSSVTLWTGNRTSTSLLHYHARRKWKASTRQYCRLWWLYHKIRR